MKRSLLPRLRNAWRAPTLRSLMTSLIAATTVPLALLSLLLVWFGYGRASETIEAGAMTAVRSLAATLDRDLLQVKAAIEVLANSPALAAGDLPAFRSQALAFLQSHRVALNVVVMDAEGNQLLNTLFPPGTPLPTAKQAGILSPDMLESAGRLPVSNVFTGPATGRPMLAMGVLHAGGARDYIVVVGMDAERLTDTLQAAQLPASWNVSFVDRRGTIITRIPFRREFLGTPATENLRRAMAQRAEGTLLNHNRDGTAILALFTTAPKSGLMAVVGVPRAELYAPVRAAFLLVSAFVLLTVAMAVVLANRLGRRITVSTHELVDQARQVGRGHVAGAPRLYFQEADQVRLGINLAAAELQQVEAELADARARLAAGAQAEMAAVVHAAQEPMLVVDAQLAVRTANAAAAELLGRPAQALVGQVMHDLVRVLVSPDPASTDDGREFVGRVRRPDGAGRTVRVRTCLFEGDASRFMAVSLRPLDVPLPADDGAAPPA